MIMVGLAAAVLIGFLGIVIDLGRLFVTKTEMQSAMDACALAAAAELRPGVNPPDVEAINRAVERGDHGGQPQQRAASRQASAGLTAADIWFSDRLSDNSTTFPFGYVSSGAANPATARYAMCARTQGGINTWFMQVAGRLPRSTIERQNAWGRGRLPTMAPSQMNCAIPIGLCKKPSDADPSDPLAGMVVGQWVTSKLQLRRPPEVSTGSIFRPRAAEQPNLRTCSKGRGSAACLRPERSSASRAT